MVLLFGRSDWVQLPITINIQTRKAPLSGRGIGRRKQPGAKKGPQKADGKSEAPIKRGDPSRRRRVTILIATDAGTSQELFNGGKKKGPQDIARYHCGPKRVESAPGIKGAQGILSQPPPESK